MTRPTDASLAVLPAVTRPIGRVTEGYRPISRQNIGIKDEETSEISSYGRRGAELQQNLHNISEEVTEWQHDRAQGQIGIRIGFILQKMRQNSSIFGFILGKTLTKL